MRKKDSLILENMILLPPTDSWKKMYEKQADLQEKLGRLALSRSKDMRGKCFMIMEEVFCLNKELGEMMDKLPWKHWRRCSKVLLKDWISEKTRSETLVEYVDGLHFFLNIGLILGFSPEEIFSSYIEKNKINVQRQQQGY